MKYQIPKVLIILVFVTAGALADGEYALQVPCVRARADIRIDGSLADEAWEAANWQSNFRQSVPKFEAPATEKTSVAFVFDDENIYIAVRCNDSHPRRIRATRLRHRDKPASDDSVQVIFDTYLDQNRGAIFMVNALGAKEEGQVNGFKRYNWDWNEVWDVACQVTGDGWQAEFRIPLRVLRFGGDKVQQWGVNVSREIKRKHETLYLVPPPPPYDISNLNYAAKLTGMQVRSKDHSLQFVPYVMLGVAHKADGDIPGDPGETASISDGGFDVKYSLTSDLTLDLTYNTDFAQVEADDQQVNLSRSSIFFPEKREFFLENAQLFNFGSARGGHTEFEAFFSRNIGLYDEDTVPMDFGLRLTGKIGSQDIGILSARTAAVDDLDLDPAFYHVVRVRRQIEGRSYIGGIATNSLRGELNSTTLGADGRYYLTRDLYLNGYFAGILDEDIEDANLAADLGLDCTTNPYGFRFAASHIGENFDPDLGYVHREGYNKGNIALRRTLWLHSSGIRSFTTRFHGDYYISCAENVTESAYNMVTGSLLLESGEELNFHIDRTFERLFEDYDLTDEGDLIYPPGDYTFQDYQISFKSDQSRRWFSNTSVKFGDFYDGGRTVARQEADFIINRHFRLGGSVANYHITSDYGNLDWQLWSLRVNYIHNANISVSSFLQYNSYDGEALLNVRFRWMLRNDSSLFVVFNEGRLREFDRWRVIDREAAVKISYRIIL